MSTKFSESASRYFLRIKKVFKQTTSFIRTCLKAVCNGITSFLYRFSTALSWIAMIFAIMFVILCVWAMYFNHPIAPHFEEIEGASNATKGWDWVAVGVACLSLFYACVTFNSQRNTEKNTMKITPESQKEILEDYCRHFYRNLVIICAIENKLNERFNRFYPSEEHLLKLKVDLDDLHPAAFYNHHDRYRAIQELLVKMRNFNTEVEVAKSHLCDRKVDHDTKKRDFATLKFKMSFLSEKTYETLCKLWPKDDWNMLQSIKKVVLSQADKDVEKYPDNVKELMMANNPTPYFNNTDIFFTQKMLDTEEEFKIRKENKEEQKNKKSGRPLNGECKDFMVKLNVSIWIEMTQKSTNSFASSEKIHLIPFLKNPGSRHSR